MYKKVLYFLSLILVLTCCKEKPSERHNFEVIYKSEDFPTEKNLSGTSEFTPSLLNIEEWGLTENGILCNSYNTDKIFYLLDPVSFNAVDSFGNTGQGPGEFIYPHIVKSAGGKQIVMESTNALMTLKQRGQTVEIPNPERYTYNSPTEIEFPIIAAAELSPDRWSLNIINFKTGEKVDSLVLQNELEDKSAVDPTNWRLDGNKDHVVMAHYDKDEVYVLDLDNGKIANIKLLKGKGVKDSSNNQFYADIECGLDYFYLLSLKNVDYSDQQNIVGNSEIEVYDYAGNPIALYHLSNRPRRILLDEKNKSLITLLSDEEFQNLKL